MPSLDIRWEDLQIQATGLKEHDILIIGKKGEQEKGEIVSAKLINILLENFKIFNTKQPS